MAQRVRRVLRRLRAPAWSRRSAVASALPAPFSNTIFETCPSGLRADVRRAGDVRDAARHRGQRDHRPAALQPRHPARRAARDPRAVADGAATAPVSGGGGAALHLAGHRPVPAHHPGRADPRCATERSPPGPRCCSCTAPATTTSAHYDRPDEFVIDRYPRGFADADHLSFTIGIHVCLGGTSRPRDDRRVPRAVRGAGRADHHHRAGAAIAQRARPGDRRSARPAGTAPGRGVSGTPVEYFANLLGSNVDPVPWARPARSWRAGTVLVSPITSGRARPPSRTGPSRSVRSPPSPSACSWCRASPTTCCARRWSSCRPRCRLQRASSGRYEAGLGAGWASVEIEGLGHGVPGRRRSGGAVRGGDRDRASAVP